MPPEPVKESMEHLERARRALTAADQGRPPLDRNASRLYDIYTGQALEATRELMALVTPDDQGNMPYAAPATSAAGEGTAKPPEEEFVNLDDEDGEELTPEIPTPPASLSAPTPAASSAGPKPRPPRVQNK